MGSAQEKSTDKDEGVEDDLSDGNVIVGVERASYCERLSCDVYVKAVELKWCLGELT